MFWQIIAANKRRTVLLVVLMGAVLAALGFALGELFSYWQGLGYDDAAGQAASAYPAGMVGIVIAGVVWLVMLLVSLFGSDELFLNLAGAREVTRDMYPQLYNVVEEMKIAGALPQMPRIFLVDDPAPNAFALGKTPAKSMVCVTAGLLAVCTRDELQGVVAHELGHILNRDVLYLTVAATMLGAVTFLGDVFWRTLRYAPVGRYRSSRSGKGGGMATIWIMLIALALVIISPILSRILYFSISRRREFLADATSARLTRYPEGLASALEKIMLSPAKLSTAPSATAPFYIVNPYKQDLAGEGLFATHPPLRQRIGILRAMTNGASLSDYVKAYWSVTRTRTALIPETDLQIGEKVTIRGASPPEAAPAGTARKAAGDIIRTMHAFSFLDCPCGMRLKVPPEFRQRELQCPRCLRRHTVQTPDALTTAALLEAWSGLTEPTPGPASELQAGSREPQHEQRVPGTWQSFVCQGCGKTVQVSPAFQLVQTRCSHCRQRIILG